MSAAGSEVRGPEAAALRSPDVVMRLARMGSRAPDAAELPACHAPARGARAAGSFTRPRFDIDARGVGVAVYRVGDRRAHLQPRRLRPRPAARAAHRPRHRRGLGRDLRRSTTACPTTPRSSACAGTCRARRPAAICRATSILARANRSVRLFDRVVAALSEGRQPDAARDRGDRLSHAHDRGLRQRQVRHRRPRGHRAAAPSSPAPSARRC